MCKLPPDGSPEEENSVVTGRIKTENINNLMSSNDKYNGIRTKDASPVASSLVESLRDLGYTPETAIADIIDNAIFAGAKNVWIDFNWNKSDSRITIRDDGKGMNEDELAHAMRPGSQNPKEERSPEDLGRFGLALKLLLSRNAGFSQSYQRKVRTH